MNEENLSETTTPEPSTQRKVATAVITMAVAIGMGMAASGLAEKLNDKIRTKLNG
jgi:hypothetical protein